MALSEWEKLKSSVLKFQNQFDIEDPNGIQHPLIIF
jgi:hypothetical protein